MLALLRFWGLLDPVKHPAARLDCRGGSNPRTSHMALEFGVRCRPRQHAAQLLHRAFYSTDGAVGRLSIFAKNDFKVSLLVGAGGDSAFNGRVMSHPPCMAGDVG